jgi:flagellar biosynthesis/type III secretory pathway protein FliH
VRAEESSNHQSGRAVTAQAEEIRREARQSGETSGRKEALSKLTSLITSLEKEISLLKNIRSEFLKSNIVGIVEFACALAEQVLVAEMRVRPEIVGERACALIDRMPPGSALSLSVCPEDLETVERYLKDGEGPVSRTIPSFRSDPSIQPGSIRIESDAGLIDAGLLDALKDLGAILIEQARTQAGWLVNSGGPDGA